MLFYTKTENQSSFTQTSEGKYPPLFLTQSLFWDFNPLCCNWPSTTCHPRDFGRQQLVVIWLRRVRSVTRQTSVNTHRAETDLQQVLPVTWKVHLPAPASLMTLQVYSPQPSRFRLRMVYSVSSRWASKAPAWSSLLDRSHSKRSTREGWARSTLQVITTGLPKPWRFSV